MAPKAFHVSTTLPFLPSRNRKPFTTKEKVEAAEAKESKRKIEAQSPPPDADNVDKRIKKRKTKCLPPPDEIAESVQAKAKGKGSSVPAGRKNPLTTKEKIRAAQRLEISKEIGKGVEKGRKKDERSTKKAGETEKVSKKKDASNKQEDGAILQNGRVVKKSGNAKSYVPSALTLMSMGSNASAVRYEDRRNDGVLYRPTTRASADQQKMAAKRKAPLPQMQPVIKFGQKKPEEKPFRLMDLPKEIRHRIWKLAVVHHPVCVWPDHPKGKEQPDLCMTAKAVREEVLPVFYGENIFGIDITPLPASEAVETKKSQFEGHSDSKTEPSAVSASEKAKGDAAMLDRSVSPLFGPEIRQRQPVPAASVITPDPIAKIKRWATVIESGGHLGKIQHWLFSSTSEVIVPPSRIPQVDDANSVIIFVRMCQESVDGREIQPANIEPGSVTLTTTLQHWRAAAEIHREACCVLPKQPRYQRCVVQMTPEWVNGVVNVMLRGAEKYNNVRADVLTGVADIFRSRVRELLEHRCDMKS